MNTQTKLYFSIFLGLVLILLFVIYAFLIGLIYFNVGFLSQINDQDYIKILITLISVIIGFSAIGMYTSFHVNIDNEKASMNKLLADYEKKYEILETAVKKLKEHGLDNYLSELDFRYLSVLISEYVRTSEKREAIGYLLSKINMNDSMKYTIKEYYNHLLTFENPNDDKLNVIKDLEILISKHHIS